MAGLNWLPEGFQRTPPSLQRDLLSPLSSAPTSPLRRKWCADGTLFLGVASRLDAFSGYPQLLSCPALPSRTTGTPEATRRCSSRTGQRFPTVFLRFHQVEADLSHDGLNPAHVPL